MVHDWLSTGALRVLTLSTDVNSRTPASGDAGFDELSEVLLPELLGALGAVLEAVLDVDAGELSSADPFGAGIEFHRDLDLLAAADDLQVHGLAGGHVADHAAEVFDISDGLGGLLRDAHDHVAILKHLERDEPR